MAIPLTVADFTARMKQAIGNSNPSTGFVLLDVLNESVQYIFTYSNWSWRQRAPILLDLVSGQDFVSLPPAFGTAGEVDGVASLWSPLSFVFLTGLNEIARYRGLPVQNFLTYYLALSFPTQASTSVAPAQPRLEIWPTPQTSVTGAFRIIYRAGPVLLTDDTNVPNLPPEFTTALTLVSRARAMQYELGSSVPETLAEMAAATAELDRLMEYDGLSQADAGHIGPGAAAKYMNQPRPTWFRPFASWPGH